jgi:hypothetical protein
MLKEIYLSWDALSTFMTWLLREQSGCQSASSILYVALNCEKVSCLQSETPDTSSRKTLAAALIDSSG